MKMIIKYNRVFILLTLILAFCGEAIAQVRVNRRSSDRTYTFNITNNPDDSTLAELSGSLLAVKYQPLLPYQQLHAKVLTPAIGAALTPGVYVIDSTTTVSGSVHIPDGVFFIFSADSTIYMANSTDSLWMPPNSFIADPESHIFYGSGKVRTPGSTLHVKNFGAKGDGVTEDAPAIQACADALRGEYTGYENYGSWGSVIFPEGTFIVNPTLSLIFAPDSSKAVYVYGAGEGTHFANQDFTGYGGLFGDFYETGDARPMGDLYYRYFVVDSTHQGDADGTGGNNTFGTVLASNTYIEYVKIHKSGNRAIAFEGYGDGYAGTANGFGNVYLRHLEITDSWKNAISINKHDTSRIKQVVLEHIFIRDWSRIVPGLAGQGTGFASTGINILARQTTGDNPGHDFYLNNITMEGGYSNAIEFNGLDSTNNITMNHIYVNGTNVDSATTPAGVLITNAYGGTVNDMKITNVTGGPAWRDRTGNGNWYITNSEIRGTRGGTAKGYFFDVFNTPGYMVSNSKFIDNDRGVFGTFSGSDGMWFTGCYIEGDTLSYYTAENYFPDNVILSGTRVKYTRPDYTVAGVNILENSYFAADSGKCIDRDSNGIPDGWNIYFPYDEIYRDSLLVYINPDSGLVLENLASQQLDFIFRQNLTDKLDAGTTYTFNMRTVDDAGGNTLRMWVNTNVAGGAITTSTYQLTGQAVTSYIGIGRAGATGMAANSRLIVKWMELLPE